MAVPKSVVKISKKGVQYTSSVDRVQYTLIELTRAALRDVGRFIAYRANARAQKLKGLSKSRRVRGRTSTFLYNVPWAKRGLPHLEVGVKHGTWYGEEQELGTSNQPRRQILRNTAHVFESLGYEVKALDRVYFAGLTKKGLKRGEWRYLTEGEINLLRMGAYL